MHNDVEAIGVHQSDIIIRAALVLAIEDMRANPWLLDYVFASLKQDTATSHAYGAKEIQRAKDWFVSTDIPVLMDYRVEDSPHSAFVTVSLMESAEKENTLADIHYQPTEDVEANWPPLVGKFSPKYNPDTGIMEIPQKTADALVVAPGMVVVDATGRPHEVLDVRTSTTFRLATGIVANFSDATIKGSKPKIIQSLESLAFQETYRIGCHVTGDPFRLTWLHSIIVFILLRYKAQLIEGRGFERTTIASAPFSRNDLIGQGENMWTRMVTISGTVRHVWPSLRTERILSVGGQIKFYNNGDNAYQIQDGFLDENSPFLAEDSIGEPGE